MASFTKAKLKAARDAIAKKDYKTAEEAASQVLEYDNANYNAYVYSSSHGSLLRASVQERVSRIGISGVREPSEE